MQDSHQSYGLSHHVFILVTPPLKNVRKKRFRKTTKKVSFPMFVFLLGELGEDYVRERKVESQLGNSLIHLYVQ